MKIKFVVLSLILIFVRGCDFYSTSLWYFDNPSDETNPLSRIFGFGWSGLIVFNLVIVGIILYLFYIYTFKYSVEPIEKIPLKLTDYISKRYFGMTNKFHWVFYKIPKNKKAFSAHLGYVSVRVLIIASILATIHNLCQFYNISIYDNYRNIVKRPLFVIYGLIILSTIYFLHKIWKDEFEQSKNKV